MKWTSIYSIYSAVPANMLVFVTPGAVISSGALSSKWIPPEVYRDAHIPISACFLLFSLTIPLWLSGLFLSVLYGPIQIRDHRNVETYLERLNKSAGDPSEWPAALAMHSDGWAADDEGYARKVKFAIATLIGFSLVNSLVVYLLFVLNISLFLLRKGP